MNNNIKISKQSNGLAIIDIEGLIGVPENGLPKGSLYSISSLTYEYYTAFINALEEIYNLDSKEIIVNIRSTGGNPLHAFLIYDALNSKNANITTRCYGYVADSATIIAQVASSGQREISGASLYLIHSTETDLTNNKKVALYASKSKKPTEEIVSLMKENNGLGRWLTPEEVVSFGLADKIIKINKN